MPRSLGSLVALLLLLVPTAAAHALELAGRDLIIPIAGRTAGAAGSFWRTDLLVSNLSPESHSLPVTVETWIGGERLAFELEVPAHGTISIEDFLLARFGREQGLGVVRISSPRVDAQLAARARVYTTGDVGQSVPALPAAGLAKNSTVAGLTVSGASRANIGIANPGAVAVPVTLTAYGQDGARLDSHIVHVAAHSVMQHELRSVFASDHLIGDLTVSVQATEPVYAFGSVVRTASSDPSFVMATTTRPTADFVNTPLCAQPAELRLTTTGIVRPGWIISFEPSTNVAAATAALVAKYGFTATFTFGIHVAIAELTPSTIAQLRCEPGVKTISQGSHLSLLESGAIE